jgi:hypothetical protein
MIAVRMMQMTIDQVVHMVTVRDWLMPAIRSMHVSGVMLGAIVLWCALVRIMRAHVDHMLLNDAVISHVMQMAIVKIVSVITVTNRRMPAILAVDMSMVIVGMLGHQVLQLNADTRSIRLIVVRSGIWPQSLYQLLIARV